VACPLVTVIYRQSPSDRARHGHAGACDSLPVLAAGSGRSCTSLLCRTWLIT
jgi:hypothetical protein